MEKKMKINNENTKSEKIMKNQLDVDEEIIYVTSSHWSLLLGSLFLMIVPFDIIAKHGFMALLYNPIGLFLLLFSSIGIFLYFNFKIILTNKRYIKSIGIKQKDLPLNNIILVKSSTNILGGGRLFVERIQYSGKLMQSANMIKNAKELELKINEQLKSIKYEFESEFKQNENHFKGSI
jgi:hypothetical protein